MQEVEKKKQKSRIEKDDSENILDIFIGITALLSFISVLALLFTLISFGDDGIPAMKIELIIGGISFLFFCLLLIVSKIFDSDDDVDIDPFLPDFDESTLLAEKNDGFSPKEQPQEQKELSPVEKLAGFYMLDKLFGGGLFGKK